MNAYSRFLRPADQARRSTACSRGDGFARATSTKARELLAHSDSGDADALGWLALYDGNLAAARKSLRPEVESTPEALAALALLARTRADTAPVTGRAFLALARGDTAAAAAGFEKAASELGDAAPLLLATAARLYAAHHSEQQAIALWSAIVTKSGDAPEAPEAELDWARALRARWTDASGDRAPRAPHPHLSAERAPAAGAPRAGAVAKRHRAAELSSARMLSFPHAFLESLPSRFCCAFRPPRERSTCSSRWTMSRATISRRTASRTPRSRPAAAPSGCSTIAAAAFLLPDTPEIRRRAGLDGVSFEPLDDGALNQIRGVMANGNMDAVPLEKAPKIAIYTAPYSPPWDDAVTLALKYAGIPYTPIWDDRSSTASSRSTTGFISSTKTSRGSSTSSTSRYRGAPWFAEQQERSLATAQGARLLRTSPRSRRTSPSICAST